MMMVMMHALGSERFEHPYVRLKGFQEGIFGKVGELELLRRLLHNLRKIVVVHMADVGEQVVFYLVIESRRRTS